MAEKELAAFFDRKYAITTCNGSAAIVIALRALGIGPGNRVLLPVYTWVGCATAVLRTGATPVFADSCVDSPIMDIPAAFREHHEVDAILGVHTYASSLDFDVLESYFPNTPVIEDISHVHGGKDTKGQLLGRRGRLSISSFQATKLLTCGEGGAVFTNEPELAQRLQALRADSRVRVRIPSNHCDGDIELEPHGSQQGANYALSEISAALLSDQLRRLPDQLIRRARGAERFIEEIRSLDLNILADLSLVRSGGFYRLPIVARRSANEAASDWGRVRESLRSLNIKLERAYVPITDSPLYRPETINGLAPGSSMSLGEFPNARRWSRSLCPLPHELFLAPTAVIEDIARRIRTPMSRSSAAVASRDEPVTVIILTRGTRSSLSEAIDSVAAQEYPAHIKVLLVVEGHIPDNAFPAASRSIKQLDKVSVEGTLFPRNVHPLQRVSRLRNLALSLVDTPLVAFLDDDNRWEPEHLSSLSKALSKGPQAAHSWRILERADGRRWTGDNFPWLPPSPESEAAWQRMVEEGVFTPGEDLVRDVAILSDGNVGMVDLGEWLFRTSLIRQIGFATKYSREQIDRMIGEDDRLLLRLVRNRFPLACSEKGTLVYRLGGFSNSRGYSE